MRRALALLLVLASADLSAAELPWEFWKGPRVLPRLVPGDQVLLQSSRCPSNCRYDRTSEGDTRFLRVDGDEAVILEERGAGAITRIWMTAGLGVSEPLDPSVRIRIRLDGEETPRVDLPLPDLFRGTVPPFLAPLVGDRDVSSGGFFSYVPIPYRRGCRVSLVGALSYRLWFQLTYHRLAEAGDVATFTGREDLSALAGLLSRAGADPWPGAGETLSGRSTALPPRELAVLDVEGPGLVTGLRLRLPLPWGGAAVARLDVDGTRRAELPLSELFAVGTEPAVAPRSLLLGVDAGGWLYSYFPMPFWRSLSLTLVLPPQSYPSEVGVDWEVRVERGAPPEGSGFFTVVGWEGATAGTGRDLPLLDRSGRGKWVGLFAELRPGPDGSPEYLEGDERVYVDGSPHPSHDGTGAEDFFGGGFYFDRGPFSLPLHGCLDRRNGTGSDRTVAYRLLLSDAVPYASSLRVGLEPGPTGYLAMSARTVAYLYEQPAQALLPVDAVEPGDPASRAAHRYEAETPEECRPLDGSFGGDDPGVVRTTACYRRGGAARFELRPPVPGARRLRLRRRLDAADGSPAVAVLLGGEIAGELPAVAPNPFRRLLEQDLDLPGGAAGPLLKAVPFELVPVGPAASLAVGDIRWELLASPAGPLCDGSGGDPGCLVSSPAPPPGRR